ncbi:hypothetical protein X778_21810 [Pseudomonas aeruginosa VRFPA07]|nr:hypothetical protein X778_21810 [Pseudomonas aeruginosa VRFPA07]
MPVSRRTIRARDRSLIATRLAHSAMLARSPGGAGQFVGDAAQAAVVRQRQVELFGRRLFQEFQQHPGETCERAVVRIVLRLRAQVQDQFEDQRRQGQGAAVARQACRPGLDEEEADLAVGGDPVAVGDAAGNPHAEPGRHHPQAIGHRAGDAAAAGHHQLALAMPVHRHLGVVVPGLQLQGQGRLAERVGIEALGEVGLRFTAHGRSCGLSEFDYFLAE